MSTKIYYAYRMKTEYLEIFLRLFQEKKNEIKEEAMLEKLAKESQSILVLV